MSPIQTVGEVGRWAARSRLTDMLLDPKKRAILVGLKKRPRNELARTAATTLQQLAGAAVAEPFVAEEEPEE
jgi:hypothetical protein